MVTRTRPLQVRQRGATFVEVVIASGLMVGVSAAALSVFTIATRATQMTARTLASQEARDAMRLMRRELSEATTVTALSNSSVAFTTPDRNSDGTPESITYTWNGTASTALTRTQVGSTNATLMRSVGLAKFLDFTADEPSEATVQQDATTVLLAASTEDPSSGNGAGSVTGVSVTSLTGIGLVLQPALPSTTQGYTISQLKVRAKKGLNGNASTTVSIRTVSGGRPTGTVLGSTAWSSGSLSGGTKWETINFAPIAIPAGTTEIGVVFMTASLLSSVVIDKVIGTPTPPNSTLYTGLIGAWLLATGDLEYELFGTINVPKTSSTNTVVPALSMEIRPTDATVAPRVEMVRLPNRPVSP